MSEIEIIIRPMTAHRDGDLWHRGGEDDTVIDKFARTALQYLQIWDCAAMVETWDWINEFKEIDKLHDLY
jgi:hypothetical protein